MQISYLRKETHNINGSFITVQIGNEDSVRENETEEECWNRLANFVESKLSQQISKSVGSTTKRVEMGVYNTVETKVIEQERELNPYDKTRQRIKELNENIARPIKEKLMKNLEGKKLESFSLERLNAFNEYIDRIIKDAVLG